ncbi:MAG TPA: hypothetical protein VN937_27150 [Blastocatellia bacterium]|nr:hypothetical protein [Blastocatellia bacterium]
MKTRLVAAAAMLLMAGTPASAHRLDEYLQATTISVERDRVQAQVRLTPGVAVFPMVLANIDTDADGIISEAEQRAYAARVLGDMSLTIDGDRLQLRLVSLKFAKIEEMKEGGGEIQLEFDADVSSGGPNRRLIFENHHENRIAAYLVNCLVPRDPDIRITAQDRNYQQSFYQLNYVQAGVRSGPRSSAWWSSSRGWLGAAALLLFAGFAFVLPRLTGRALRVVCFFRESKGFTEPVSLSTRTRGLRR